MKDNYVCLFPGQGSQSKGMGKSLFLKYPNYLATVQQILGYDIAKLCLENPNNQLQKTQYTQPALYVVNALSYLEHVEQFGQPDMLLGHSLGEFNALWAAGVYDFETGLKIVQKRGAIMAQVKAGSMAAIIGMERWEVAAILEAHFPSLDICNINTYTQIVIGGKTKDLAQAAHYFDECGVGYVPLAVSGAFHSRYMQDVQGAFAAFLNPIQFSKPNISVISNVEAKPYTIANIRRLLTQQICQPVQWLQSIEYVLGKGPANFYEMGSKTVLSNLVKKIRRDFQTSINS